MKFKDILKSPVFAPGHRWSFEKSKKYYESDTTALVRKMLEDERIREDQRFAWDRWRADTLATQSPVCGQRAFAPASARDDFANAVSRGRADTLATQSPVCGQRAFAPASGRDDFANAVSRGRAEGQSPKQP